MNNKSAAYRDYDFAQVEDGKRTCMEHQLYQASYCQVMEHLRHHYVLAALLKTAQTSTNKVRNLDFGCGEGLYLHDVAALLEERGLLQPAELYGIDLNEVSIATAEAFSRVSTPPRPYLNFYLHNGLRPL